MKFKKTLLSLLTASILSCSQTAYNTNIKEPPEIIVSFVSFLKRLDYCKELSNIKDNMGQPWFDLYDVDYLVEEDIPLSYIKTASLYSKDNGNPAYSPFEISQLHKMEIPEDFLEKILVNFKKEERPIPSPLSVSHYLKLCKDPGSLFPKDTPRKNALIVMPDERFPKNAFYNEDAIKFYDSIVKSYDSYTQIASSTKELCDIIFDSYKRNFNPDLFVLAGHGDTDGKLSLSNKSLFVRSTINNKLPFFIFEIDRSGYFFKDDKEVGSYLSLLNENLTVFLWSCYSSNFSDFIQEHVKNPRFIGSKDAFASKGIYVHSINPLDLTIFNCLGEDVTFTNYKKYEKFGSKPLYKKHSEVLTRPINEKLRPRLPYRSYN